MPRAMALGNWRRGVGQKEGPQEGSSQDSLLDAKNKYSLKIQIPLES